MNYLLTGELIGSVRFCGTGSVDYVEMETYKTDDGDFYNVKYSEIGDNRYKIEIYKHKDPMVRDKSILWEGEMEKNLI